MAGGREYSRHQQQIIRRHYQTLEARSVERLRELVSELFLAETEASRGRLWKQVRTALKNSGSENAALSRAVERQDLDALAREVAAIR